MARQRHIYKLDEVLPPAARDALRHLELLARRISQGMLHGIHRSRRKGISTDFDHHKLYQPGDPLKHVDWKVSARHDEYFVKRYLEDTALAVRLVIDRSASMRMQSGEAPDRYLQAARLAACLAYLVLKEKDGVGLALTAGGETQWLPVRYMEAHLVRILQALVSREASGENDLDECLKALLDRGEQRGMIIVVSDFLFEPSGVRRQLARLSAQGHEVLMFRLEDATEADFPFNRWVRFEDLENPQARHLVDAVPLRKVYLEEYRRLMDEWREWARKYDMHFMSYRTDAKIEALVSEYLAFRAELAAGR